MNDARKIICNFKLGLRKQSLLVLDSTNAPVFRIEFTMEDFNKELNEILNNPEYEQVTSIIFSGAKFMKDRAFLTANQIKNTQFKNRKLEVIKL